MFDSILRLISPLNYIRIKHPTKKNYDFFIPLLLTLIIILILYLLPFRVDIFSKSGLISIVTDIIGILTGFFIASLAAVATFNKPSMDIKLPGTDMTLSVTRNGIKQNEIMTSRKLLSYLFGYLSFVSIIIYFSGEISILTANDIKLALDENQVKIAKNIFIFLYLFMFNNLIVNTFLGIFFMSDYVHRT